MARTESQSTKPRPEPQRAATTPPGPPPQQIVEGSTIGKRIAQSSDQEGTQQRVASSSAEELHQDIAAKKDEFSAFGVRGRGLVAVLIAGMVVVVLLVFKYFH